MQSHAAGVTKYQNILWTEWTNEHTLDDYVKGVKKREEKSRDFLLNMPLDFIVLSFPILFLILLLFSVRNICHCRTNKR